MNILVLVNGVQNLGKKPKTKLLNPKLLNSTLLYDNLMTSNT
jgi:hypothetical protein